MPDNNESNENCITQCSEESWCDFYGYIVIRTNLQAFFFSGCLASLVVTQFNYIIISIQFGTLGKWPSRSTYGYLKHLPSQNNFLDSNFIFSQFQTYDKMILCWFDTRCLSHALAKLNNRPSERKSFIVGCSEWDWHDISVSWGSGHSWRVYSLKCVWSFSPSAMTGTFPFHRTHGEFINKIWFLSFADGESHRISFQMTLYWCTTYTTKGDLH